MRIPSIDEEDLRCSHRERSRLVGERTAHINRITGLLFAEGIRGINVKSEYKTLAVDKLTTGEGHRLPPRLDWPRDRHSYQMPAHASGFYGSNVIELCPPRGGYNPVGLRKVPDGAR